jgi:hypothetical protein
MENSPFVERRTYPRLPVNIPLRFSIPNSNSTFYTQTNNISAEGLSFETEKELVIGTCLDICLRMIDNNEEIYRKGKVIWSKMLDVFKYRIGIKIEKPQIKPIPLVLRTVSAQRKPFLNNHRK